MKNCQGQIHPGNQPQKMRIRYVGPIHCCLGGENTYYTIHYSKHGNQDGFQVRGQMLVESQVACFIHHLFQDTPVNYLARMLFFLVFDMEYQRLPGFLSVSDERFHCGSSSVCTMITCIGTATIGFLHFLWKYKSSPLCYQHGGTIPLACLRIAPQDQGLLSSAKKGKTMLSMNHGGG